MRKIAILILVFLSINTNSFSQLAVTDPTNGALLYSSNLIQSTIQGINELQASAALDLLDPSLFSNMTTIMEILEYIDQIACQTQQLSFNMRFAKNFSCLTKLNVKGITMNLNYSSQVISKLFTASEILTMSKEGRMNSLDNILKSLKTVSRDLGEMNINMKSFMDTKIASKKLQKEYLQVPAYSVARNR